jgi:hypothetical protein
MTQQQEPSKEALLTEVPASFDTAQLKFDGLRGDALFHLSASELDRKISELPDAPMDKGTVDLLVAGGADFSRILPATVELTTARGMPNDRFELQDKYGSEYQLATTRTDYATVIANGQALELHGDNLFLNLELSSKNLPLGSRVRVGRALLEVTPQAHNGCKKWVQRFGLAPMRLNLAPHFKHQHLRGIYFRVIEDGVVAVGDTVEVVFRP